MRMAKTHGDIPKASLVPDGIEAGVTTLSTSVSRSSRPASCQWGEVPAVPGMTGMEKGRR
jgi:hypothetical protein